MIIKSPDDRQSALSQLEGLLPTATSKGRQQIEEELRKLRAGIEGERESAFHIDFFFAPSDEMAILHDLRLELDGRSAQIDHLLIHSSLTCFVLETKRVHAGIKITEQGEFLRWNHFSGRYEAMESPLAQNERHVLVLRDLLKSIWIPGNAEQSTPTIESLVLVPPKARLIRPDSYDTGRVIKSDQIAEVIARILSANQQPARLTPTLLEAFSRKIVACHRPITFDYGKKFGGKRLGEVSTVEAATVQDERNRPSVTKRLRRGSFSQVPVKLGVLLVAVAAVGIWMTSAPNAVKASLSHLAVSPNSVRPPQVSFVNPTSSQLPQVTRPSTPAGFNVQVPSSPSAFRMPAGQGTTGWENRGTPTKRPEGIRSPGMGAPATLPERGSTTVSSGTAVCEIKPVMTDAEMAACRRDGR